MGFQHKHEHRKIALNLVMIFFFAVIIVIATIFSKPIRRVVNVPKKLVAGVHDSNFQDITKENFSKEIVNDTKDQVTSLKNNFLKTTVGDILNFISQGGKIGKDIHTLEQQTTKSVNSFDPFKK